MKQSNGFIYGGSGLEEYMLRNVASLPRFGQLARKAMAHYLGDSYTPNAETASDEGFLRRRIAELVAYKVFYRVGSYDWEWIDHSFRQYFAACYKLPFIVDKAKLEAGFRADCKAPTHLNELHAN